MASGTGWESWRISLTSIVWRSYASDERRTVTVLAFRIVQIAKDRRARGFFELRQSTQAVVAKYCAGNGQVKAKGGGAGGRRTDRRGVNRGISLCSHMARQMCAIVGCPR